MDQNPCYVELMGNLARYRKHSDQAVTAVQLDLDTTGFVYQKWGAEQRCKQGDWLVNNNGDTYTIDSAVFARTYRKVAPGRFVKTTSVWVRRADHDGSIKTIEGESHYRTGDYLVFNNEDGTDGYCMSADSFDVMYELDSSA